uniref:Uncharacterized protein n=1 Tax=Plectus sambesii TaxID=2011161 RepID=A0A914XJ10_9BILA
MKNSILYIYGLIAVATATNITEAFFDEQDWSCIQGCYANSGFNGKIRLIEMVLPEYSLIFDICNALTTTQTCADQCNCTNSLAAAKPFAYLCDGATLSELQKHEVCYTDINNEKTKTTCGEQCGGQVDEMAEKLHRVMGQNIAHGTNSSVLTSSASALLNATIETCSWQKCYVRCAVDNIATLCRDSDPEASIFSRTLFEELGYAYYDDMKSMGLADVLKTLPEQCNFMMEPSTIFEEHANAADAENVHAEQIRDLNEEEFWKQRQQEEEKEWSTCLKKCAADLNYVAEMDRFDEIIRGGDYADQFLNQHTMCRANEELRQCLSQCNGTSTHQDDTELTNALCGKELFLELQAHEQCYSKSREAKSECQDRCKMEDGDQKEEGTTIAIRDKETCRMRKCVMRCHYDIVVDTCDETDPEASKFMLKWFDQMRRGANFFLDSGIDQGAMEAVLSQAPGQCHYFLNKNVTLFDENSSVRCSLTYTCTIFLLFSVAFSFFNSLLIH